MNDGRRRRRAKQARRDARRDVRRARALRTKAPEELDLPDFVRRALAEPHPFGLLGLVGFMIKLISPDPLEKLRVREGEATPTGRVVAGLVEGRNREATALLAVLAELLVDEPELQDRCRQEVAERNESLPTWISALSDIEIYRAVRASYVLGDEDELVIGARLGGEYELTATVHFDHSLFSGIDDAEVWLAPIDEIVSKGIERNTDAVITDMGLSDARAWIEDGLEHSMFVRKTDPWQDIRALVRWLAAHMPEGGTAFERPECDFAASSTLISAFFAAPAGAPFQGFDTEALLLELFETGVGDPLRWSPGRIDRILSDPLTYDRYIPLEYVLEVPELLRAFIPFVHAQSGIREDLTAEVLEVIDGKARAYRRAVLADAGDWGEDYGA